MQYKRGQTMDVKYVAMPRSSSYDSSRVRRDTRPQIRLQKKHAVGQHSEKTSLFSKGWGRVRTHSFATGPVMAEPFISPLGLTITPALSCRDVNIPLLKKKKRQIRHTSKYRKTPSLRRHALRWRTTTMGIATQDKRDHSQRPLVFAAKTEQSAGQEREKKGGGGGGYSLFFLNSGFPFFTDATTMSPTPASGSRFRCEPVPYASIR